LDFRKDLIAAGQTVVLGLSGGPDSVCLLHLLLAHHDGPIVCAHVNHGLRGAESDGDETFVADLCKQLDVPLELMRIDAAALARETGLTVEEAGRAARYAFFDEICEQQQDKGTVIALAHNKDDQVETVFMRILRGTGTDGLAGIPVRRKSAAGFDIVRPLLGVSRSEIDSHLKAIGAAFRTDSSNLGTDYLRNKVRLDILPFIEDAAEVCLKQSLTRLSANAAEDKDYFDALITKMLDTSLEVSSRDAGSPKETDSVRHASGDNDQEPTGDARTLTLPAALLVDAHPAVRHRLIRRAFLRLGLDRDVAAVHLAAADRLLDTWAKGGEASGKRVEFPQDYTFGIRGKYAVFRAPGEVEPHWKPKRSL
jgi:tRNA(Ile)-lysidine synthase